MPDTFQWLEVREAGDGSELTLCVEDIRIFTSVRPVAHSALLAQIPDARCILELRDRTQPVIIRETYSDVRRALGLSVTSRRSMSDMGIKVVGVLPDDPA